MTDQKKTRISLPTTAMTRSKSASGGISFHCGDAVAQHLAGLPLNRVKATAGELGLDHSKYDHLNPGQQRMNVGNLIRSHVRKNPDAMGTLESLAADHREAHEAEAAEAKAAQDQAKADAKAAKEAKAADEKAAKAAAKAEAKAKKDAEKAAAKAKAESEAE